MEILQSIHRWSIFHQVLLLKRLEFMYSKPQTASHDHTCKLDPSIWCHMSLIFTIFFHDFLPISWLWFWILNNDVIPTLLFQHATSSEGLHCSVTSNPLHGRRRNQSSFPKWTDFHPIRWIGQNHSYLNRIQLQPYTSTENILV